MAALVARVAGRKGLTVDDLDDEAGCALAADEADEAIPPQAPAPEESEIEAALGAEQGNVARAAARLGISRSRMRRFVERRGIDVALLRSK
jgi:transcriptional regulator of acetoin/glycerol metabolism